MKRSQNPGSDPSLQAWSLLGHASNAAVPPDFASRVVRQVGLGRGPVAFLRDYALPFAAAAALVFSLVLPNLNSGRPYDELDRLARLEAALQKLEAIEEMNGDADPAALLLAQFEDPTRLSDEVFLTLFY